MGKNTKSFNYQFPDLAGSRRQPYRVGDRVLARQVKLINDCGGECVLDEPPIRVLITAARKEPDLGWRFEGRVYEPVDVEKAHRRGTTDTCLGNFRGAGQPPGLYEYIKTARQRFDPTRVSLSEWHVTGRIMADDPVHEPA